MNIFDAQKTLDVVLSEFLSSEAGAALNARNNRRSYDKQMLLAGQLSCAFLQVHGCETFRLTQRCVALKLPYHVYLLPSPSTNDFSLRQYATLDNLQRIGGSVLRPWQLPHRADYGLRGTADSET